MGIRALSSRVLLLQLDRAIYSTCTPFRITMWPSLLRPSLARVAQLGVRRLATAATVHKPIDTAAEKVYPPFARYVHACEVPADARLIFTSGQLGITPEGAIPATAEEQTAVALKNIEAVLKRLVK